MFYCFNIKRPFRFLLKVILVVLVLRLAVTAYFNRPYHDYVKQFSEECGLEESLVYAVMFIESKFDKNALSPKEAKGLMQIADITGAWGAETLGIENFDSEALFDPKTNVRIGCWYLNNLTNQFEDLTVVLAAYNAGSGNVSKWLDNKDYSDDGVTFVADSAIPFLETRQYVRKVKIVKFMYDILY